MCAALPRNAHTSDAALHRRRARRRLGRCKGVEVAPAAELSERGHREPDVSCGRLRDMSRTRRGRVPDMSVATVLVGLAALGAPNARKKTAGRTTCRDLPRSAEISRDQPRSAEIGRDHTEIGGMARGWCRWAAARVRVERPAERWRSA